MFHTLTDNTINGFPLWVVLLICVGVFLASFMDAIAGGGGIISAPTHLIAFGDIPAPYALGTNKVSACIGTGTFLMILFIRAAKLDTRHAAGGVKVINLASNVGSLATQLASRYVFLGVGLTAAVASVAGHAIGSGLAIKGGSKIVRPTVILVLILLTLKVGSELLFPEFWA